MCLCLLRNSKNPNTTFLEGRICLERLGDVLGTLRIDTVFLEKERLEGRVRLERLREVFRALRTEAVVIEIELRVRKAAALVQRRSAHLKNVAEENVAWVLEGYPRQPSKVGNYSFPIVPLHQPKVYPHTPTHTLRSLSSFFPFPYNNEWYRLFACVVRVHHYVLGFASVHRKR